MNGKDLIKILKDNGVINPDTEVFKVCVKASMNEAVEVEVSYYPRAN